MKAETSGFKLHDMLLLIGLEGRTGELVVESGNNIGTLLFHDGKILLAFSPYTRTIGDILVEQGVLTDGELLDVLKQQLIGPHMPTGMLLQKTGKVTFKAIEIMVQEQIRRAIKDFNEWSPLEFSFVQKDIRSFDGIHLPVYEFLPPDIAKAAFVFVEGMANVFGPSATMSAPVTKP